MVQLPQDCDTDSSNLTNAADEPRSLASPVGCMLPPLGLPLQHRAGTRLAGTALEPAWRSESKFVVAGAGALGSEVFRSLCLLRPARLLVIDPDSIEESDLAKSWLLSGEKTLGKNKAEHLSLLARTCSPETDCYPIRQEFADVGWEELADASLVFSCVDSDLARLEIALVCRKLGVPVCDAGLSAPGCAAGRVTWFPARSGACFGCKLRPKRLRELLSFAQAEVRSCSVAQAGGFAVTPTMASLIGSLQVDFGLRKWMARAQVSESLELSLEPAPNLAQFENAISSGCPFHNWCDELRIPALRHLAMEDLLAPVATEVGGDPYVYLEWPFCVLAKCRRCSHQWQPMIRCSALRKHGTCPRCAEQNVMELDSVRVVERGSKWARYTPGQLGLPENHLLTIRFQKKEGNA